MNIREEYEALIQSYQKAVRNGNSEALANLFAEDAMIIGPDQPVISGKKSIRTDYADAIGDGFMVTITIADIQECGDVVYANGSVVYSEGSNKWLQVLRRQDDGALLIHRLTWN